MERRVWSGHLSVYVCIISLHGYFCRSRVPLRRRVMKCAKGNMLQTDINRVVCWHSKLVVLLCIYAGVLLLYLNSGKQTVVGLRFALLSTEISHLNTEEYVTLSEAQILWITSVSFCQMYFVYATGSRDINGKVKVWVLLQCSERCWRQ